MADQFTQNSIPTGTTTAFPDDLQGDLDYKLAALNTLAEQQALHNYLAHGVGRLSDGCNLSVSAGVVRLENGYFYAGPGVDSEDSNYFKGARIIEVAGGPGYIELTGSNAPPLNKSSGTWGYMSYYGDVDWFDAKQTTSPQVAALYRRWLIGKAVTDGAGAVSVDDTVADIIPVATGGGGEGGGDVTTEQLEALQAQVDELAGDLAELQALTGQTPDAVIPDDQEEELAQGQMTRAALVHAIPTLDTVFTDSIPSPRFAGMGQVTGDGDALPDVRGGGNATLDFENDRIA